MSSVKKHNKSLIAALNALGSAGIIKENMDKVEQKKAEALQELANMHLKLEAAWANLRRARNTREEVKRELQGESLDDLGGLVIQLRSNLKATYHNAPSVASHSSPMQSKASLSLSTMIV